MDELTKEQKYTVAKFYKLYMERSNEGLSEEQSNDFKDSITTQDDYFCDREYEDFIHNCKVLIEEGYLEGDIKDQTIYNIKLTTKAFTEIEKALVSIFSKVILMDNWKIDNHSNRKFLIQKMRVNYQL